MTPIIGISAHDQNKKDSIGKAQNVNFRRQDREDESKGMGWRNKDC